MVVFISATGGIIMIYDRIVKFYASEGQKSLKIKKKSPLKKRRF